MIQSRAAIKSQTNIGTRRKKEYASDKMAKEKEKPVNKKINKEERNKDDRIAANLRLKSSPSQKNQQERLTKNATYISMLSVALSRRSWGRRAMQKPATRAQPLPTVFRPHW